MPSNQRARNESIGQMQKSTLNMCKMIRGWVVDKRAINVVYKLMILEAEMMTIENKKRNKKGDVQLIRAFDKAIVAATKAGFLQDAAVAAHLASRAVADKETSQEYVRRSRELYLCWGAIGVIDYLEAISTASNSQAYSSAESSFSMSADTTTTSGTPHRARRRFDKSLQIKHQHLDIGEKDTRASISAPLSAQFPTTREIGQNDRR